MLDQKLIDVLNHEGAVAIISSSASAPGYHVVNTWNSYVRVAGDKLYIPAAGMHSIEGDMAHSDQVLLTLGSKEVEGTVGPGAGFHVTGRAAFIDDGEKFDEMKAAFPFLTRVLEVTVEKVDQKI